MARIAAAALAGLLIASLGLVAVPEEVSAHICDEGASCDGSDCPNDGHTHVHYNTNSGPLCWAIPVP